jgi:hypothetical protein
MPPVFRVATREAMRASGDAEAVQDLRAADRAPSRAIAYILRVGR